MQRGVPWQLWQAASNNNARKSSFVRGRVFRHMGWSFEAFVYPWPMSGLDAIFTGTFGHHPGCHIQPSGGLLAARTSFAPGLKVFRSPPINLPARANAPACRRLGAMVRAWDRVQPISPRAACTRRCDTHAHGHPPDHKAACGTYREALGLDWEAIGQLAGNHREATRNPSPDRRPKWRWASSWLPCGWHAIAGSVSLRAAHACSACPGLH